MYSKFIACRHILKSIVKELNEKTAKILGFFWNWINLIKFISSHANCHADPDPFLFSCAKEMLCKR